MISSEALIRVQGVWFHWRGHSLSLPYLISTEETGFCLGVSDLHTGLAPAFLVNTKQIIEV